MKLKIHSSRAADKNLSHNPQRIITASQNWRRAMAVYVLYKEPRMISENQPTNSINLLASYLTFPKGHFVFQKISTTVTDDIDLGHYYRCLQGIIPVHKNFSFL
jgi:hypothetical protein